MLPTCPACKQSVLDDDATECPFCGANMKTGKGGGAAKPPAAKPVAPAAKSSATPPPASKAPPSKSTSKPTSRKSSLDDDDDDPFAERDDDDDPFAAAMKQDAAAKAKAIAVSPKKTKTHVEELKCPMCDTVGFVPENVGGKDVKCSNPKCPVPVFMAPKKFGAPAPIAPPPKKAKPEREGPSRKPLIFAIIGGVALVAAVGLAVLFWPEPVAPPETDFAALAKKAAEERAAQGLPPVDVAAADKVDQQKKDKDTKEGDAGAAKAVAALDTAHLLGLMEHHSLEETGANKKYCRQRVAIGYATVNDIKKMREQLDKLDKFDASLPHFKIPALLTLGWQQLAAGNKVEAAKTADEALAASSKIGRGSRDTQESVIDLAAFLVATAKLADAHKLLEEHFVADASTPLVVRLAYVRHRQDFDFDQGTPGKITNPQADWGAVGVTLILASEGLWNDAQLWAEANPDVEARTDCILAWADARLRAAIAKKEAVDPNVEGIAAKLSPAGKVLLMARLALTQATAGNTGEAERLLTAARDGLKALPIPPAARYEGFKAALEWKALDPVPLRQTILAATAIGVAQAKLKKLDEAWLTMVDALQYARAMAPSPASVARMKAQAEDLGTQGLREKLRAELQLNNQDEAIRRARDLKNKLDSTEQLAVARFKLQDAVLKASVAVGLGIPVWKEAVSLSQRQDPQELEPYLAGTLPAHLIEKFNAEGLESKASEVNTMIQGMTLPTDDVVELKHQIAESLKSHKLSNIVTAFSQRRLTGDTEEFALETFAKAAKEPGKALPTLAAVTNMETRTNNQFVKLEALRMLAGYASRQGNPTSVRDAIQGQKQSPLERISAYLGTIEGYTAWQRAQPAPKVEEEKAKTDK